MMPNVFSRWCISALVAASTLAVTTATFAVAAQPAWATSSPYCNSSSCSFANGPNSGDIYFQMPRNTAVGMICWTDTQWFDGTNRWFKVSTIYGVGYMSANQVGAQTKVGHCSSS